MVILALSKDKKLINEIHMTMIHCSPIFAPGVLHIATINKLYAIVEWD